MEVVPELGIHQQTSNQDGDFIGISSVAQVFSRMATESERFIATSSLAMRSDVRQTLQKFREKPLSKPSDKTKAFSIVK